MSSLVEISQYVETILRLDLETPVKGYDGTNLGPSNEQAQALANRTKWLKGELDKLGLSLDEFKSKGYVLSVNGESGDIVITPSSIKAANAVHTHTADQVDPTPSRQYVTTDEKTSWDSKQDKLVNKISIASINGKNLLDGGEITIATNSDWNGVNVSQSEIDSWNNKQNALVDGKTIKQINSHSLLGSGSVNLTYEDVNADRSGAAVDAVTEHVGLDDPHEQYLTQQKAENKFVLLSKANAKSGWLQLDSEGKIPPDLMDTTLQYKAVKNEEERLALPKSSKTIMCLQGDNNTIYYLNPNEDPSVDSNWIVGRSTELDSVTKVFGRIGEIIAVDGDYTADQITETTGRVFVHPDDKANWDSKQKQLENEVSIKSINDISLLGAGKIKITPAFIGAMPNDHQYTSAEIILVNGDLFVNSTEKSTWNNKQDKLVDGKNIGKINGKGLISGDVTLNYEDVGAAESYHIHPATQVTSTDEKQFVSSTEKKTWNNKQDKLTDDNFKTINGETLLGQGKIVITPASIKAAEAVHSHTTDQITQGSGNNHFVTQSQITEWSDKQDKLISGTNISTVFGQNLLLGKEITLANASDLSSSIGKSVVGEGNIKVAYDDTSDKVIVSEIIKMKGNYTLIDVPNAFENTHYGAAISGNDMFDIDTKVFKKGTIVDDGDNLIDYSQTQSYLIRNSTEEHDATGVFPLGAVQNAVLSEDNDTNTIELYTSKQYSLSDFASGTVAVGVNVTPAQSSIVPEFTIVRDGTNDVVTKEGYAPVCDSHYNKLPPQDAFGPEATGSDINSLYNYWSSNVTFNNKKGDIWLGITRDTPYVVESYSLQCVANWYWGNASAAMTAWSFQARLTDSDDWVTLDTRSGENLLDKSGVWKTYKINNTNSYSQYRFLITAVNYPSGRPSIGRIRLNQKGGILMKDKNGVYYDGKLNKVSITTSTDFINHYATEPFTTPLSVATLNDIAPVSFCAMGECKVDLSAGGYFNSIAIDVPIHDYIKWKGFKSISIVEFGNEEDRANLRFALTADGENYYVYKNEKWNAVTRYDTTVDSYNRLLSEGMKYTEINAIDDDGWEAFKVLSDVPDIKMSVINKLRCIDDYATPKAINVTSYAVEGWLKADPSDVKVGFTEDTVDFAVKTPGTYKFFYRVK